MNLPYQLAMHTAAPTTPGADGLEYCDYSFLCMTGAMSHFGFDYDRFPEGDEETIGAIDAPCRIPAGCMEFVDNPFMKGVFAVVIERDRL